MKVTLITVGKIKEKYLQDAIREYSKRLSRYCRLEIIETPDEKTPDQLSENQREMILKKEGSRILRHLTEGSYIVTLDIRGKMLSSEELAAEIERLAVQGISHLTFIIGGSLGLCAEVQNKADLALSFSKMTFPHQLMRVIFLEQLYRSYRIIANEPYHK